jgi:hypothetical protein
MSSERVEPSVGRADAVDLCLQVYASREEAVAVARRLRAAGWIVPLLSTPSKPRGDGTRVVATVYEPGSFESPGEITYRVSEPD